VYVLRVICKLQTLPWKASRKTQQTVIHFISGLKDSTQTLFTMKCIHSVVERFCDWQYTDGIVHLLFAEQVLSTSVLTDAYRLNQLAVK